VKLLRIAWIALLLAGALGFAIGTALRMRVERPRYYIGAAAARDPHRVAYTDSSSALALGLHRDLDTEIGSAPAR
jgi:hypothetical protein